MENRRIADRLEGDPKTVGQWRRRFAERGVDGLYDAPRPGQAERRSHDDTRHGTTTLFAAPSCQRVPDVPARHLARIRLNRSETVLV